MWRFVFLLLLGISLSGCVWRPFSDIWREYVHDHPVHKPDPILLMENADDVSEVIWGYASELRYDKHLRLEKSWVCTSDIDGKSTIHIEFSSQDILELCEARQLFVDVIEGFLDRINNKGIMASFEPSPFTANNLEIYIDFQSFYGEYVDPFYIGWVTLQDGIVYYYAFTLKDHKLDTWNFTYETYAQSKSFALYQRAAEEEYRLSHPTKKPTKLEHERYHPL